MSKILSGAEFKEQLRSGSPKMGLFLNAHSPTVAEQLAHSGYDWLLVDIQHGPMGYEKLSSMLCAIASGGAKSMAFNRRSTSVRTASSFLTSTPRKRPVKP